MDPFSSPNRATEWMLRSRVLSLRHRPLLMGIVNVTPDSFSDGGRFFSQEAAVEHGVALVADGADLIDVGGESTRPYAEPVDEQAELARVIPVVEALADAVDVPLSIDTRKAAVAREAIDAGAEIVNDVSGLEGDPNMLDVVAASGAAVCVMHMRGDPQTMQDRPEYEDVLHEVHQYLRTRQQALRAAGIDNRRICLDPGIGFGKTNEHNWHLLGHCHRLHEMGCPVMVGHSRKRFLGALLGDQRADRVHATVGVAMAMAAQGVQVLRVHEVRPVREALLAFEKANRPAD